MSFVDKVAAAADKPKVAPAKEAAKAPDKQNEKPAEVKQVGKVDNGAKGNDKLPEVKPADKAVEKRVVDVDDSKIDWSKSPGELRKAHERTVAENKELRAKLESKSTPKVDEIPEYKELSAKVQAKEKEYAELKQKADALEETIRYVDYEKSPEFQQKFQKPWVDAYQEGVAEATRLSVPNVDATGEKDGTTRKLTKEEFDSIVTDPDLDSAIDKAEKLFQNATRANQVLEYRKRFISATKAMEDAKKEYRTKGAELEKQTAAQRAEQQKMEQELWTKHNKEWAEKNPQWVTPDEGDDEGAKKLELGKKAADLAFADTSHLDPEKRAKLYADTKNRAAAFGHVAHKLTKAEARITELEAKLKEYEESVPAGGAPKLDAPVAEETMKQKIANAANRG